LADTLQQLFAGTTVSPIREFVAAQVDPARHSRVVLPCVGRWSTATAVAKHVQPSRIEASDLSLFSSVIGYLADPRHTIADLDVVVPDGLGRFVAGAADETEYAAGLLLTLKFLATPPKNAYLIEFRNEMWANATPLRASLAAALTDQTKLLAGCRYDVADMRDVTEPIAEAGPDTFYYVNPPGYAGGYTKMYAAAEQILWDGGLAAGQEFTPDEIVPTLVPLTDADALALSYAHHGTQYLPPRWTKLMVLQYDANRFEYIAANRDEHDTRLAASKVNARSNPRRWPIYAEEEITPESVIEFTLVNRDTGLHYRDLFVHRLGQTKAEIYVLMLVDGRVVATCGLHRRELLLGRTRYIGEVYGISVTSRRYARLNRLFMMALTSRDFYAWCLASQPDMQAVGADGIQTSSPAVSHEVKINRGILKLVSREPRPGGGFHLIYRADWSPKTWPQMLAEWLNRHAWACRDTWDGPRLPEPNTQPKPARRRRSRTRDAEAAADA
jgi:hypothetical protein